MLPPTAIPTFPSAPFSDLHLLPDETIFSSRSFPPLAHMPLHTLREINAAHVALLDPLRTALGHVAFSVLDEHAAPAATARAPGWHVPIAELVAQIGAFEAGVLVHVIAPRPEDAFGPLGILEDGLLPEGESAEARAAYGDMYPDHPSVYDDLDAYTHVVKVYFSLRRRLAALLPVEPPAVKATSDADSETLPAAADAGAGGAGGASTSASTLTPQDFFDHIAAAKRGTGGGYAAADTATGVVKHNGNAFPLAAAVDNLAAAADVCQWAAAEVENAAAGAVRYCVFMDGVLGRLVATAATESRRAAGVSEEQLGTWFAGEVQWWTRDDGGVQPPAGEGEDGRKKASSPAKRLSAWFKRVGE